MNNFANIDANRPATFKQFEFANYKLTQGVAKIRKISEKKAGKLNPEFKILKARVSAAVAKYYGDQGQRMSHGDAQKFITSGELPKEILALVKTGSVEEPKAQVKPKAQSKPKASKKTAEQEELERLRKEVQALLAERDAKAQSKPRKPTAKEAAAAIAALRS